MSRGQRRGTLATHLPGQPKLAPLSGILYPDPRAALHWELTAGTLGLWGGRGLRLVVCKNLVFYARVRQFVVTGLNLVIITSPLRGLGDVARRGPKLSSHTFLHSQPDKRGAAHEIE